MTVGALVGLNRIAIPFPSRDRYACLNSNYISLQGGWTGIVHALAAAPFPIPIRLAGQGQYNVLAALNRIAVPFSSRRGMLV